MKRTAIGFVVVDAAEDWEQVLALETGEGLPEMGILDWRADRSRAFVFKTRQDAKAAIARTDHYRQAFSTQHPNKQNCRIVMLEAS